jgi:PhnB protein
MNQRSKLMTNAAPYIRTGFRTVTPYLIVHQVTRVIDFMMDVFRAEELRRDLYPDGTIMNVEMRLGDSIIELAEASTVWPAMPSGLHVYVPNTDETFQRAIAAGAQELYAPAEMPYGERSAGVKDPSGNHWYIATYHLDQSTSQA